MIQEITTDRRLSSHTDHFHDFKMMGLQKYYELQLQIKTANFMVHSYYGVWYIYISTREIKYAKDFVLVSSTVKRKS